MAKARKKIVKKKQVKLNGPVLARVGDPYITVQGHRLEPESIPIDDVEGLAPPPRVKAKDFKPSNRRSVKQMPAPPDIMSAIGVIFMYTVFGLSDREIASVLKASPQDITSVKSNSAYHEYFELLASEFVNANSAMLDARLAAYGHEAVTSVAKIAFNGKKEENRMRSSMYLVDQSDPRKRQAPNMGGMGTLRIMLLDGEKKVGVELNGLASQQQEADRD